jgi:hypothetical protein
MACRAGPGINWTICLLERQARESADGGGLLLVCAEPQEAWLWLRLHIRSGTSRCVQL